MGQYQDQDELRKLRRLETHRTQGDPSLGPLARSSLEQDDDQHHQDHGIGRIGKPRKVMIIRCPHDEEGRRADPDPDELLEIVRGPDATLPVRHTVNREDADPENGENQRHIANVETIELPMFSQPIDHESFEKRPGPSIVGRSEVIVGTCGASFI